MHGIRTGLVATATALAVFAGGAFAASLDSLVIHGDAAKKIHEKYAISIDTAKKMAAACVAFAKQHNVAVSISIMDPIGEMVYFERMDGQGKLNTSTAILKSKTALVTRASEDQFLGAIGVGGSNVDEECAQAALEAVVGPQPPLVQNLPPAGRGNGG